MMMELQAYLRGQIVEERFPLVEYLGGSENGAVFLTECSEGKDGQAAIKLTPAPAGGAEARLTQWRLVARFSHPHLLRILQDGRSKVDGTEMLYVVMEYGEENLGQILPQRSLSVEETRQLAEATLEALAFLHGKGFVHGSIRPANILAVGNEIKLSSDTIRRTREPGNGPRSQDLYVAPERAGGTFSPASDVWSFGVVLVECLTGQPPESTSEAEFRAVRNLPAPFCDLARHCLIQDPRRRWDVAQLRARLAAHGSAGRPGVARAGVKASRRKSRLALAVGACSLAVAAAGIGTLLVSDSISNPSPRVSAATRSAGNASNATPGEGRSGPFKNKPRTASPTPSEGAGPSRGGAARGIVIHRVLPTVPRDASNTIWGTVRVRVRVGVDSSGKVADAKFDWAGPSRYFARLSMAAARQWKFRPPIANGRYVPSTWVIHFGYTKRGERATAEEESP